jgi:2-polyprenyl-6-methoxyphenol hydroxylase-like FAD-dependent oxidoreductase
MVMLGDSALHTNPTAGRGVSLAFAHARHLAATIGQASQPIPYVAAFEDWTHANIGTWYRPQAHADTALGPPDGGSGTR